MRYRLIPTLGINDASIFVETDDEQELFLAADNRSALLGKPVMVVRYPEDRRGIQALYTVGRKPKDKKARAR